MHYVHCYGGPFVGDAVKPLPGTYVSTRCFFRLAVGAPRALGLDMLTALRSGIRFRLAVVLAALASLCFVAPPAVLAFGHGENTVNCLAHADGVDHGAAMAHGMKHHGDHPSGAHPPGSGWCGLD